MGIADQIDYIPLNDGNYILAKCRGARYDRIGKQHNANREKQSGDFEHLVNKKRDKVLMIYHNIYNSWSWLGGHADGDEDLLAVAIREAKEESGIKSIRPYSEDILSLEVLTVNGHIKNGNYVPSHLHINISYLLVADDKEELIIKPDENSGVGWFTLSGAISSSNEEWFRDRIYSKLNEKLAIIKESR